MSRLLKANFTRLFKSIFFKICLIFSAGFGIFLDMARYIDIQKNAAIYAELGNEYKSADGFVFSGALYLIFVAAAFVGIFIGTEYSDGTIRNKLMIGHKRIEIYLTNFMVCVAADILMLLVFILVTLGVGQIIFGVSILTVHQIIILTLSQLLTMAAFSAILVLLAMLIQSKAGGSVTILILTVILLMAAITISSKLSQPEYYQDYSASAIDEETGEMVLEPETVKNPHYISGAKRKVYEFLNDALPVNQFYQTTLNNTEHVDSMTVYSVIIIILANGAGIILFRKKDLK